MAGVFISYRREDAPGHAGRIFDRLRARFGAGAVFMDVTAIDAGADFVDAIERAVGTCDVLLAVIGPQWSAAVDGAGRKRLETSTDFVRLEIAGALKRNVRVVPVLVDGAHLPAAADLPDELQPLLRRNAVELRDARWDADIEQLVTSLGRIVTTHEAPLRLERRSPGRLRWIATAAVVVIAAGATAVFGPRACEVRPAGDDVAATAPVSSAPVSPLQPAVRASVGTPKVVGQSLSDARETLRNAGVDVARVLYRDDRSQAVDLVVAQSDVRSSAGRPAVALTAVARAAVVIHHRAEDADVARRLAGALTGGRTTDGVAVRTLEMSALRPESIARVNYSDGALGGTAADIANDANTWLDRNDPGRPELTAVLHPPVVARTIVIGLPERGPAKPPPTPVAALPDVRGMSLQMARRLLLAAGVQTVDTKWLRDDTKKPLEVVGQAPLVGPAPGTSVVVLDVVAKGTLIVEYAEIDRARLERFMRDLTATSLKLGLMPRLQPVDAVKPDLIGKVLDGGTMEKDAISIAGFASNWLTKEQGRRVSIRPVANVSVPPRTILFGVPRF